MADDQPLLVYRDFRPFATDGDMTKAAQVFAGQADVAWLDAERAKLADGPSEATRSSQPRCIECGQCECVCPHMDDPIRNDPYAGASADWNPGGPLDRLQEQEREAQRERMEQQAARETEQDPTGDLAELDRERTIEEQGRVAAIHGKPWHQVPSGATAGALPAAPKVWYFHTSWPVSLFSA